VIADDNQNVFAKKWGRVSLEQWKPSQQIGVGYLDISPRIKELVQEVLDSNRLSYGPFSRRFENKLAHLHGCTHGVVSNSGTSALHVALAALMERHGWHPGDEVIVPAVTFVATANVVLQLGLKPIFVDVDPDTYNIDAELIPQAISPKTRCIIPVHLCGLPADMARIVQLASQNSLEIIEDSCETMFVSVAGKPVGSHGSIGCFSTYVAHLLVTGVGGLSITNDAELSVLMRSLCNHGRHPAYIAIDDDQGKTEVELDELVDTRFLFERVGFSYRITELEAAIGLGGLEEHQVSLARRRQNAEVMTAELASLRNAGLIKTPVIPPGFEHAFMVYPLVVAHQENRNPLIRHLEQAKIETRPLMPLVNQPVYRRLYGDLEEVLPVAKMLNRQGFYIGCHQGIGERETSYIVRTIKSFFSGRSGQDH
jgi:perosamine synthetase